MLTPLVSVTLPSIYGKPQIPLFPPLAKVTPDFSLVLDQVKSKLPRLRWSDLFRSYDLQKQAHQDYLTKKKTAFSPAPGGSFHEAGRAMDIDLSTTGMSLADLWELLKPLSVVPIIGTPDDKLNEAWHFEHRGSHQIVYDYVSSGRVQATYGAYAQAARSAILAIGQPVDGVPDLDMALVQSALIRLGKDPGPIDGVPGFRTEAALKAAGATMDNADTMVADQLQSRFPEEFLQTSGSTAGAGATSMPQGI